MPEAIFFACPRIVPAFTWFSRTFRKTETLEAQKWVWWNWQPKDTNQQISREKFALHKFSVFIRWAAHCKNIRSRGFKWWCWIIEFSVDYSTNERNWWMWMYKQRGNLHTGISGRWVQHGEFILIAQRHRPLVKTQTVHVTDLGMFVLFFSTW